MDLQSMDVIIALQLVKAVRKEFPPGEVAIIALTAASNADVNRELLEAGCSQIVFKPIRSTTLSTSLLTAFGIGVKLAPKPVTTNAKMLEGKTLLVVRVR
jgi:AmiR/NasT family two-component response regulator